MSSDLNFTLNHASLNNILELEKTHRTGRDNANRSYADCISETMNVFNTLVNQLLFCRKELAQAAGTPQATKWKHKIYQIENTFIEVFDEYNPFEIECMLNKWGKEICFFELKYQVAQNANHIAQNIQKLKDLNHEKIAKRIDLKNAKELKAQAKAMALHKKFQIAHAAEEKQKNFQRAELTNHLAKKPTTWETIKSWFANQWEDYKNFLAEFYEFYLPVSGSQKSPLNRILEIPFINTVVKPIRKLISFYKMRQLPVSFLLGENPHLNRMINIINIIGSIFYVLFSLVNVPLRLAYVTVRLPLGLIAPLIPFVATAINFVFMSPLNLLKWFVKTPFDFMVKQITFLRKGKEKVELDEVLNQHNLLLPKYNTFSKFVREVAYHKLKTDAAWLKEMRANGDEVFFNALSTLERGKPVHIDEVKLKGNAQQQEKFKKFFAVCNVEIYKQQVAKFELVSKMLNEMIDSPWTAMTKHRLGQYSTEENNLYDLFHFVILTGGKKTLEHMREAIKIQDPAVIRNIKDNLAAGRIPQEGLNHLQMRREFVFESIGKLIARDNHYSALVELENKLTSGELDSENAFKQFAPYLMKVAEKALRNELNDSNKQEKEKLALFKKYLASEISSYQQFVSFAQMNEVHLKKLGLTQENKRKMLEDVKRKYNRAACQEQGLSHFHITKKTEVYSNVKGEITEEHSFVFDNNYDEDPMSQAKLDRRQQKATWGSFAKKFSLIVALFQGLIAASGFYAMGMPAFLTMSAFVFGPVAAVLVLVAIGGLLLAQQYHKPKIATALKVLIGMSFLVSLVGIATVSLPLAAVLFLLCATFTNNKLFSSDAIAIFTQKKDPIENVDKNVARFYRYLGLPLVAATSALMALFATNSAISCIVTFTGIAVTAAAPPLFLALVAALAITAAVVTFYGFYPVFQRALIMLLDSISKQNMKSYFRKLFINDNWMYLSNGEKVKHVLTVGARLVSIAVLRIFTAVFATLVNIVTWNSGWTPTFSAIYSSLTGGANYFATVASTYIDKLGSVATALALAMEGVFLNRAFGGVSSKVEEKAEKGIKSIGRNPNTFKEFNCEGYKDADYHTALFKVNDRYQLTSVAIRNANANGLNKLIKGFASHITEITTNRLYTSTFAQFNQFQTTLIVEQPNEASVDVLIHKLNTSKLTQHKLVLSGFSNEHINAVLAATHLPPQIEIVKPIKLDFQHQPIRVQHLSLKETGNIENFNAGSMTELTLSVFTQVEAENLLSQISNDANNRVQTLRIASGSEKNVSINAQKTPATILNAFLVSNKGNNYHVQKLVFSNLTKEELTAVCTILEKSSLNNIKIEFEYNDPEATKDIWKKGTKELVSLYGKNLILPETKKSFFERLLGKKNPAGGKRSAADPYSIVNNFEDQMATGVFLGALAVNATGNTAANAGPASVEMSSNPATGSFLPYTGYLILNSMVAFFQSWTLNNFGFEDLKKETTTPTPEKNKAPLQREVKSQTKESGTKLGSVSEVAQAPLPSLIAAVPITRTDVSFTSSVKTLFGFFKPNCEQMVKERKRMEFDEALRKPTLHNA